jgi:hypothetical protein
MTRITRRQFAATTAGAVAGASLGLKKAFGGGRNTGILAGHCLRVTIDPTCSGCCIYGRRCEGHGIYSLAGLSENFGSERRANQ